MHESVSTLAFFRFSNLRVIYAPVLCAFFHRRLHSSVGVSVVNDIIIKVKLSKYSSTTCKKRNSIEFETRRANYIDKLALYQPLSRIRVRAFLVGSEFKWVYPRSATCCHLFFLFTKSSDNIYAFARQTALSRERAYLHGKGAHSCTRLSIGLVATLVSHPSRLRDTALKSRLKANA